MITETYKYLTADDSLVRVFYLKGIQVYCMTMDDYGDWIIQLRDHNLMFVKNIKIEDSDRFEFPKGDSWTEQKLKQFLLLKNKGVSF